MTFRVYEEFYQFERTPVIRECLFRALRNLMFHGSFPFPKYWYEHYFYPRVFLNFSIGKVRITLGRMKKLIFK